MGIGEIFGTVFGWAFNLFPYPNAKKWLGVFTNPHETMKKEMKGSLGDGVKDLLVSSIPYAILSGIVTLVNELIFGGNILSGILSFIMSVVLLPIVVLVAMLLGTGVVWVIAKVLGGKGTYTSQFYLSALVASGGLVISTVLVIPTAIPLIGLIFAIVSFVIGLYQIYLYMKLVRMTHSVSRVVAAISVLLPLAVVAIILFVLFAAMVAAIMGSAAMMGASNSGYYGGY